MILKHHNMDYDGGSPNIPNSVGDRYYNQDLVRDFHFLRDQVGILAQKLAGTIPFVLSGGIVTQGTGDTLNITVGDGYAKQSVTIPNDSTVVPATNTTGDIEGVYVSWTAQTNMTIGSATLDGSTVNYVKVRYNETNSSTRSRAKKAGSYAVEKVPSFTIVVDMNAPTDYDICLASFVGSTGGTFKINSYPSSRNNVPSLITLPKGSLFQNPIINGNMEIAQRGTSFTSVASGTYTLDRWEYVKVGTMVHDISQDTDVPNSLSQHSLKIDCTTADASIAAGDYCYKGHKIEGYNFFPFVGKTAVLSFWVKDTKTGIHCVAFRNSVADRCYIAEYTVNTTNTWEYKTIFVPFDFSGGTWNYTNGIGLNITFTLACGSTFQTSAGSWQSGNYLATSNQVNACDSISNNFFLSQVQLNEGLIDLPFTPQSYLVSLSKCQRHYEKGASFWHFTNVVSAGVGDFITFPYAVEKRASVVPTLSNIGNLLGDGTLVAGSYSTRAFSTSMATSRTTTGHSRASFDWNVDAEL